MMDTMFASAELSPRKARSNTISSATQSSTTLDGVSGVDGDGTKTESELSVHTKGAIA